MSVDRPAGCNPAKVHGQYFSLGRYSAWLEVSIDETFLGVKDSPDDLLQNRRMRRLTSWNWAFPCWDCKSQVRGLPLPPTFF
jgi:hypothetical protein